MKTSTVVILVLAVLLGAYVYFYEMKHGKSRDDEETSKPAFTFKPEDVKSVTVTNRGQAVVIEKSATWVITRPVSTAADQATVDSLVSAVSGATIDRTLALTDTLKRASGLAQPDVRIEIRLNNGSTHNIDLGHKDPTDASVYAIVDGAGSVALLSSSVLTSAAKSLNDLRSREMAGLPETDLTSVEIRNSGLRVVAEKSGDGKWLLKEPVSEKDHEANTVKLLSALTAQATEVIDAPDEKVKQLAAKSGAEVIFKSKDNKVAHLTVSAADGESVYVTVQGRKEMYKAAKSLLDNLNFKLSDVVVKADGKNAEKDAPAESNSVPPVSLPPVK